ncbi:MAG: AMP-binding protein [Micromonosporaceae bacterium]
MPSTEPYRTSIGELVSQTAAARGGDVAVVSVRSDGSQQAMTWRELERQGNAAVHALAALGVTADTPVAVALPAGLEHVVTTIGAFKLGALVVPLDDHAAERETAALTSLLGEHVLIGPMPRATAPGGWWRDRDWPADPPAPVGTPRSASLTGGTTGLPRVVLRRRPWTYPPDALLADADRERGLRLGQVQLVVLPMHHAGFSALYQGLALGHKVVVMERFVARRLPKLVVEHRVNYLRIVPALMRMVLQVPELADYDFSSVEAVHHSAAPCPEQVKRGWLELVGPDRVYEEYASQERLGSVMIRGDEWLAHPGSVGRPTQCDLRIRGEDGRWLPPGEVGEVYVGGRQPAYVGGGQQLPEQDGYLTVGDLGYLDRDGYLYLVGRTSNVINVGGANVYPAEVEAVLLRLDGVADAVAVGRPHAYLGETVHALVVPSDPAHPVTQAALEAHCRRHLSAAKLPMSYELTAGPLRERNGKVRRSSTVQPEPPSAGAGAGQPAGVPTVGADPV